MPCTCLPIAPENQSIHPTGTFGAPQEAAKKKARAERFNLPKSKQELAAEEREKAAALAAEVAEKKRQRGERFGTLSEEDKVGALTFAATIYSAFDVEFWDHAAAQQCSQGGPAAT